MAQIVGAIEKLQVMIAESRAQDRAEREADADEQRRRANAQFFLGLIVALLMYLYPRR